MYVILDQRRVTINTKMIVDSDNWICAAQSTYDDYTTGRQRALNNWKIKRNEIEQLLLAVGLLLFFGHSNLYVRLAASCHTYVVR